MGFAVQIEQTPDLDRETHRPAVGMTGFAVQLDSLPISPLNPSYERSRYAAPSSVVPSRTKSVKAT
jgi:hypothetical protein